MSVSKFLEGLLGRLSGEVCAPVNPPEMPVDDVQLEPLSAGELIARWAEAQWARHIEEPSEPGPVDAITEYILGGAAWSTADVLTWRVGAPYKDGGIYEQDSFAWCGAFAAAAVEQLGISDDDRKQMVSPERLYANHRERRVKLAEIEVGDIITVGDKKKRKHGSHIAIVVKLRDDGLVETIEGNAIGRLPDGSVGEGVVRRTRPLPSGATGGPRDPGECPISGRPQNARVVAAYRFEKVEG